MYPYLAKKGDFPRISDGFSEISVGSKGLMEYFPKYLVALLGSLCIDQSVGIRWNGRHSRGLVQSHERRLND